MDIQISPSILGILKEKLEKVIYFKAYKLSHRSYLRYIGKLFFSQLSEGIEYDVYLESKYLSNDEQPLSKLYIKTTENNTYTRIVGHVVAKNGGVVYQSPINALIENQEQIIVYHLLGIPLKEIYFDGEQLRTTFNDVRLVGFLEDEYGNKSSFDECVGLPTYTEFLNSKWDKKWGVIWNLDFLEEQFFNVKHRFINRLAGPLARIYASKGGGRSGEFWNQKLFRRWCWFVVNIVANDKLVKLYWWSTMPLRIKSLEKHITRG